MKQKKQAKEKQPVENFESSLKNITMKHLLQNLIFQADTTINATF